MRRPRRAPVRLEVQPHACGPWLVRAGGRRLAVSPGMGLALLPLHGSVADRQRLAAALGAGAGAAAGDPAAPAAALVVAGWLAGDAGSPPARRPTSLPLRTPLVPAAAVRAAARALAPLASWPALAIAAGGGVAALALARPWSVLASAPSAPSGSAPALLLFVACAVWHELGHAAALRREGYAPGGIGAGWLVFIPVLYADVSAVALLPRAGRLRVDLAGVAFQAGAAGALASLALWPPLSPAAVAVLRLAATATTAALVGALLPLPRSDGGWALRDAFADDARGAASTDGAGEDQARQRRQRAQGALRALQHVLTGLACLLLPSRLVDLAGRLLALAGWAVGLPVLVAVARLLTVVALIAWAVRLLRAQRLSWRRLFPGAHRAGPALSCPPGDTEGWRGSKGGARVRDHDQVDEWADDGVDHQGEGAPQPLALDGVLDLHMFPPAEARALVDDWLDASREAGLRDLRIIHGKGIGALRTLVHAALAARGDVESYTLAGDASSWGATVIRMKP